MSEHSKVYEILKGKFDQLQKNEAKEILGCQFTWEDQFAKSIYQSELKEGVIEISYDQKLIDVDELWQGRTFKRIIIEWENHTPILQFNSIGECLLFYKAIFQYNGALAIKIISGECAQNAEYLYSNDLNESADWREIEGFLFGSIHKLIQNK